MPFREYDPVGMRPTGTGRQNGNSREVPAEALADPVVSLFAQRARTASTCAGLFPDTVCWTRLRNTWAKEEIRHLTQSVHGARQSLAVLENPWHRNSKKKASRDVGVPCCFPGAPHRLMLFRARGF